MKLFSVEYPHVRFSRIPRIPGVRNIRPGFSIKKLICDSAALRGTARPERDGRRGSV